MKAVQTKATHHVQTGFTLIELMISLVLGLLIVAAITQIYITMVRTDLVQRGAGEIGDVSIFGIQNVEQKLRMANLGNPENNIHQETDKGGVVLSQKNIGGAQNSVDKKYFTHNPTSKSDDDGVSGTDKPSDTLTIQYINVTGAPMIDCESNVVDVNDHVIERYFLRKSQVNGATGLALACDAGRVDYRGIVTGTKATGTKVFGDSGSEMVLNVEQFKVLLGVQKKDTGQMVYISPSAYTAVTNKNFEKAPIVAIRFGMIVRSDKPIIGTDIPNTAIKVLGEDNTPTDSASYIRKVYESTSMLRNARVIKITVDNASETF
ncbi:putative pilus assembly protein PilW [Moraxella macacae 0408225]|uniref:Putative pilus assembly protein PilW n=1 Tax=Moraxella macacae 0408225 TaxID=1230338 RepID=L2FBG5_9GAMM|nr:PilW family protein [Moraxella macacae]ELA09783.1 putative pilus assembly protein PilW [Moraxella macacae 0408225]